MRIPSQQSGFALVSALLMLLVLTLLGVSMFLGVGLQQGVAGNATQKTRALELAQSAMNSAENWLAASTNIMPVHCSGLTTSYQACLYAPSNLQNPSAWSHGTQVGFSQLTWSSQGGAQSYYQKPMVAITYLGNAVMGPGKLYQIDAWAYGGKANAVALVESVFYVGGALGGNGTTPAQSLGQ